MSVENRHSLKILVTTPEFEKLSGVAHYNALLKKYFSGDADFMFIGSRRKETDWIGIKRFISNQCDFRRTIARGRYDLVHLNPSLAWKAVIRDGSLLQVAKANDIPVVIFIHGWKSSFESQLRGWRLRLFKNVFFKADAMIVLANEFKEKIRRWGYPGPIYTETTAIDDEQVGGFTSDVHEEELPRGVNLLFLARLEKTKGIYESMEAYRMLRDRCADITLTIAGDGPELEPAQRYATRSGLADIRFVGDVRGDVKDATFRGASIYLLPTYGEGMPTSVLEAMAYGLPIVTRAVGGLKDFFENGKMGFMTQSLDPLTFARISERLIIQPELRRQIGRYNREYAREHFLASKVAGRIEAIYRAVSQRAPTKRRVGELCLER